MTSNSMDKPKSISNKNEWLLLSSWMVGSFFMGSVYSLQAPFFPSEAEKKGLSPSEYSFVFAVYELAKLFTSLTLGVYITYIGINLCARAGLFATSVTVCLFGILYYVESTKLFLTLAILVRTIEAIGNASFVLSLMTTLAVMFPETVGLKSSLVQTAGYIGVACGPVLGGLLYATGGYITPFLTLGGILLTITIVWIFLIPKTTLTQGKKKTNHLLASSKCLKIPGVWLSLLVSFLHASAYGFIIVTLEPRLKSFSLDYKMIGLVFFTNPAINMALTPIYGKLHDKGFPTRVSMILASVFKIIAFSLLGPVSFIAASPSLTFTVIGLVFQGLSGAAFINAVIVDLIRTSAAALPEEPIGVVSSACMGLLMSASSLAMFLGPLFGGYMLEYVGFEEGSLVIVVIHLALACLLIAVLVFNKLKQIGQVEEIGQVEQIGQINQIVEEP